MAESNVITKETKHFLTELALLGFDKGDVCDSVASGTLNEEARVFFEKIEQPKLEHLYHKRLAKFIDLLFKKRGNDLSEFNSILYDLLYIKLNIKAINYFFSGCLSSISDQIKNSLPVEQVVYKKLLEAVFDVRLSFCSKEEYRDSHGEIAVTTYDNITTMWTLVLKKLSDKEFISNEGDLLRYVLGFVHSSKPCSENWLVVWNFQEVKTSVDYFIANLDETVSSELLEFLSKKEGAFSLKESTLKSFIDFRESELGLLLRALFDGKAYKKIVSENDSLDIFNVPIRECNLSIVIVNILSQNSIFYLSDLLQYSEESIQGIENMGPARISNIVGLLESMNLHLGMEIPEECFWS